MAKLRAPDSMASVTVDGVTYAAAPDCSVEVPDHIVGRVRTHGFVDWVDEVEELIAKVEDEFAAMKREGLFTWLREHGVVVRPPVTNDTLREACRARLAEEKGVPTAPPVSGDAPTDPSSPVTPTDPSSPDSAQVDAPSESDPTAPPADAPQA